MFEYIHYFDYAKLINYSEYPPYFIVFYGSICMMFQPFLHSLPNEIKIGFSTDKRMKQY